MTSLHGSSSRAGALHVLCRDPIRTQRRRAEQPGGRGGSPCSGACRREGTRRRRRPSLTRRCLPGAEATPWCGPSSWACGRARSSRWQTETHAAEAAQPPPADWVTESRAPQPRPVPPPNPLRRRSGCGCTSTSCSNPEPQPWPRPRPHPDPPACGCVALFGGVRALALGALGVEARFPLFPAAPHAPLPTTHRSRRSPVHALRSRPAGCPPLSSRRSRTGTRRPARWLQPSGRASGRTQRMASRMAALRTHTGHATPGVAVYAPRRSSVGTPHSSRWSSSAHTRRRAAPWPARRGRCRTHRQRAAQLARVDILAADRSTRRDWRGSSVRSGRRRRDGALKTLAGGADAAEIDASREADEACDAARRRARRVARACPRPRRWHPHRLHHAARPPVADPAEGLTSSRQACRGSTTAPSRRMPRSPPPRAHAAPGRRARRHPAADALVAHQQPDRLQGPPPDRPGRPPQRPRLLRPLDAPSWLYGSFLARSRHHARLLDLPAAPRGIATARRCRGRRRAR